MASFDEILNKFKSREEEWVENVSPLVDDSVLRNGLVAWKSVAITIKPHGECHDTSEAGQWNWMWNQVEYDQMAFQSVSGVKMQDLGALMTRLIGLRLIYPDGTINQLARDFLQAQILAKLTGKKSIGRPKKDKVG